MPPDLICVGYGIIAISVQSEPVVVQRDRFEIGRSLKYRQLTIDRLSKAMVNVSSYFHLYANMVLLSSIMLEFYMMK